MLENKYKYKKGLYKLWIELVKFQNSLIKKEEKALLILEGRGLAPRRYNKNDFKTLKPYRNTCVYCFKPYR